MILPEEFVIEKEPLFLEDEMNEILDFQPPRKFLLSCSLYRSPREREILKVLGCDTFNFSTVNKIVRHRFFRFSECDSDWIRRFCKYLRTLPSPMIMPLLELPFLKTQRGIWLSPSSHCIYLPSLSRVHVPSQINLYTLDDELFDAIWDDSDLSWQIFLSGIIGLKRLTEFDVVKAIAEYHVKLRARQIQQPNNVIAVILEHANYLMQSLEEWRYDFRLTQILKTSFQLVDTTNCFGSASQIVKDRMYDSTEGYWLLSSLGSKNIQILNDAQYSEMMPLIKVLSPNEFPPILDGHNQTHLSSFYTYDLAPKRLSSNTLLYVLATVWKQTTEKEKTIIVNELHHIEVICENKNLQPLSRCYLRTRELTNLAFDDMNFLELLDVDNDKWGFLKQLGVTTRPTQKLYLDQLLRLKQTESGPNLKGKVEWIYRMLELYRFGNIEEQLR